MLIQCVLALQENVPMLKQCVLALQADVPHVSRLLHGGSTRPTVRRADGYCSGGQQAISVRVPPVIVARGR
jgi:hypothetical protein